MFIVFHLFPPIALKTYCPTTVELRRNHRQSLQINSESRTIRHRIDKHQPTEHNNAKNRPNNKRDRQENGTSEQLHTRLSVGPRAMPTLKYAQMGRVNATQ